MCRKTSNKKLSLSIMAVLIFSLMLQVAPVAQAGYTLSIDNVEIADNRQLGLSRFIDYISKFFNNPEQYALYDKNGTDISSEFYNKYLSLFQEGNFNELQQIVHDQVAYMGTPPVQSINSYSYSSNTRYDYYEWSIGYLDYGISRFELQAFAKLTYYVDSSGKIVEPMNNPIIETVFNNYYYDFSIYNLEAWYFVSDNGNTVTFGGEFDIYLYVEGVPLYAGSAKVEAKAYSDGTFEYPTWEQTAYA